MNAIEAAFVGTLGQTPTLRTAQSGKPWCSCSVLVSTGDEGQWVGLALFGAHAEAVAGLEKGTKLYCEGRLKLESWEKDGQPRTGLKVAVSRLEVLGQIGKRKPAKAKASPEGAPAPQSAESVYCPLEGAQPGKRDPNGATSFADAEIPF